MSRVAIVTGASSGLGEALARQLASDGWHVGVTARRADLLSQLVSSIQAAGGIAAAQPADISDRSATLSAITALEAELGPSELLIANAGVGTQTYLEPMNVPQVEQMIRVNLLGVMYSIEAVLPGMLARRRGHLVSISSLGSYMGFPGEAGYCASKAAVNVYMEALRIQLCGRGIAVTNVCPGFIKTSMTDANKFAMPGLMDTDRAARLILRAVRQKRKDYNFPWQTALLVKMARWLPDWVVARVMRERVSKPPTIRSPGG